LKNNKTKDETQTQVNQTDSLLESLLPASQIFKDAADKYLTFQDFVIFMRQCDKTKSATSVVQEFTKDIPSLIKLIDQCHSCIKNRKLKNRSTRIKRSLCPAMDENTTTKLNKQQ